MSFTGAQAVVKCLEYEKVEYIFGMTGHSNLAFFDALYDSNIRLITMPHEQLAAHAADAYYRVGRKVGSMGDIGTFSFHSIKNMTTLGEGGMLTTNRDDYAKITPMLRSMGVK